ncbi:MAG: YkgJ family cysteine cluster protein [Candidatus Helarchaeota archaeon]
MEEDFCSNKCDGHCCWSYVVLITSEDAVRLAKNLDLSPFEYLTFYEGKVESNNYYPIVTINGYKSVLGIKYSEELKAQNKWPCFFFDMKTGLCQVHKFKPMVCATYPFSMDAEENLGHLEKILCPEKWAAHNEEPIKAVIKQSWREVGVYKEKAKKWNEKHKNEGFDKFLKFMGVIK